MLKRGPRSEILIGIRLDWIGCDGDLVTVQIPATEEKLRRRGDPDLPILLGEAASRLRRAYVDNIRENALLHGDEKNPYLFLGQDRWRVTTGQPSTASRSAGCQTEQLCRSGPHL